MTANVEKASPVFLHYQIGNMAGVDQAREESRRYIAYGAISGFLVLLGLIVVLGWMVLKLPVNDVLMILTATAATLAGVVGAVVGFYFRESERQESDERAFNEKVFDKLYEGLDRHTDKLFSEYLPRLRDTLRD